MKTIQEKSKEILDEFEDMIISSARDMFGDQKGVNPFYCALTIKNGEGCVNILKGISDLFVNDEGKSVAAVAMAQFNKTIKPVATAFITEGWVLSVSKEEKDSLLNPDGSYVKPSMSPNRKEALVINFEKYDSSKTMMWEIIRDGSNVTLGELEETGWIDKKMDKSMSTEGRFTSLLENNYSEIARELRASLKKNMN